MLLLAAVFALLQLANVTGRDTPDSKNYVSYALDLGGADKREAAGATIDWVCAGQASLARRGQSVDVIHFHRADPAPAVLDRCRGDEWRTVDRRLAAGQTDGHIVPFNAPRLRQIFEVRPGYPAYLLPFVSVLGVTWGVWLASVAVTVAGGVLVFLILRTLAVSWPLAVCGQALYYVLPCGTTAMRPMTEGLMLALTLAAVWGCALALAGRVRAGAALAGGALLALFAVKHSQSLFLGVCLAAAGGAVALWRGRRGMRRRLGRNRRFGPVRRDGLLGPAGRDVASARPGEDRTGARPGGAGTDARPGRIGATALPGWRERAARLWWAPSRRAALALAAVGCAGAVGTLLLARLLHYPSESESLQDLLTGHFTRPDRTRPWPELLRLEGNFWLEWTRRQFLQPLFLTALAAGAWGAARRPAFGCFLLAAAFTGVLTQAGHPDINIWGDRLIVLAWLLPVVGLPLLLEPVVHRTANLPAQALAGRRTQLSG